MFMSHDRALSNPRDDKTHGHIHNLHIQIDHTNFSIYLLMIQTRRQVKPHLSFCLIPNYNLKS